MIKNIIYKNQLGITIIALPVLILFAFLLFLESVFAYEIDTSRYWDYNKIGDYELTYGVNSLDKRFHSLVDKAIEEWKLAFGGVMTFPKTKNIERADIEFKEGSDLGENDDGKEIGSLTQFRGFDNSPEKINNVDVFILDSLPSKEKYNLIKHEIGHVLGLRQADSTNSMMWENMYERETHDIGICEIYMVYWANGLEQAYYLENEYGGWTKADFCPDEDGKYTGDDDEDQWMDESLGYSDDSSSSSSFSNNIFELTVRLIGGEKYNMPGFTVSTSKEIQYIGGEEFEDDGKAKTKFILTNPMTTEWVCINDGYAYQNQCYYFSTLGKSGTMVTFSVY